VMMLPQGPSPRNPGSTPGPGPAARCPAEMVWPIAALKRSTSSGSVQVCPAPIGTSTRARRPRPQTWPVSTSMTRPAMLYAVLL